jgi:glutaredoxin
MNNYYIKAIMLENCPYSVDADKILKTNNLQHETVWINNMNKETYITDMIQTFPQIYLKKYNSNQHLLLGGRDDLALFMSTFYLQKINETDIQNFMQKYKWSKKATLRLIQLINIK